MHDSSLIYEYIRKVKTSRHLSVIHSVDALWICFVSSILHCPALIFSHFLTFYLSFSVCCSHSFANIAKPKSSYHRFAGITFCMWVCRFFSAILNSNKNSNSFSETRKREPMKNDENIEEEKVCVWCSSSSKPLEHVYILPLFPIFTLCLNWTIVFFPRSLKQ